MFTVTKLTVDYLQHPSGVSGHPQFGWQLKSDRKNVIQTAYQIQIGKEGDFSSPVFDSGKISSSQSAQIQTKEFQLEPLTSYAFRVKAWNNYDEVSAFSDPENFLTALTDNCQWKAPFITAEAPSDQTISKGTYVRGVFRIEKPIKNAYMTATALGLYHPYLNGEKIGDDEMAPGWTAYQKRLLYQTFDVTDLLTEGENVWGAHLGAGWYKGTMGFERIRNIYGAVTAFSAQILVRYKDGSQEWFLTDDSFTGCDSPVLFSEIYDGELYDARLEQEGWNRTGFDDSSWHPVRLIEQSTSILVPQNGCKVRELLSLPVKEIFTTPEGDTVLDFGQNLTGWVHVKVDGSSGEKLILNCFEVLDKDGNVYTENLRSAKETLTYICNGKGEACYRPHFTFQGFRYIRVAACPGEIKPENFIAWAVHSDMEDTGYFACSNPLINQLQHNILWGLRGNFLDIPTDCPQRDERLGWTGDAQIFCRTATYLKNTYPFFCKWLKDVAAEQTPEGAVPHVVPDILSHRADENWLIKDGSVGATAWADVAVIAPWTLYLQYGDTRILEEQYESMKGWIDFMTAHAEDSIWHFALQFGDWVALDGSKEDGYHGATPTDLICTAYYAYSTGLFVKMAKAIGRMDDAASYQTLYDKIVDSYRRHYIQPNGHMTVRTQTAQIITLYFQLADETQKKNIVSDLLELLKEHDGHLVTGFVGTPYFCHALSQNGHTKEAYDLLLKEDFPSWLYQVKMGATTIWEHWDGIKPNGSMWSADMNSFNHYAYGAIGEWLYRVVGGIEADPDAPGYKHILFQPHTGGGLTWVKNSYESIYGTVSCSWRTDGQEVLLEVTVPANTTAAVILEENAVLDDQTAEKFLVINGQLRTEIGSGSYHFRYLKKSL